MYILETVIKISLHRSICIRLHSDTECNNRITACTSHNLNRIGRIQMKENGNTDMSENKTAYIDDAG